MRIPSIIPWRPMQWSVLTLAGLAVALCPAQERRPDRAKIDAQYGRVELGFEANWGQADPAVKFLARGAGYGILVTPSETVLTVARTTAPPPREGGTARKGRKMGETASVRMKLAGASGGAEILGVGLLPGKVNYFVGQDPSRWRTGIPTYRQVRVRGVYPGVDVVYYGTQRELEYDFVVAPGADPEAIRLAYEGVEEMRVEANGDLILRTKLGEIRQQSPVVYQEIGGKRKPVQATHVRLGQKEIGFRVRGYDRAQPLTIDPRLSYSTLFGGSLAEGPLSIAVDSSGNAYITGFTISADFPMASPGQSTPSPSAMDVFVTKLDAAGAALVYSTYLHGADDQDQLGQTITVDGAGAAYVGGITWSYSFPTTAGAYKTTTNDTCCVDGFISKLSPSGSSLAYSTYITTSDDDLVSSLATDPLGAVYATGETTAFGFPTTAGAYQTAFRGVGDVFILKLNAAGSALVYSTLLGGTGEERGTGIAVDSAGNAHVTGWTDSPVFPTTAGAYQTTAPGALDAFYAKLNSGGTALLYSTRLGGGAIDSAMGVALDPMNNAYVVGRTASTNFPATAGAYQAANRGGTDAFVVKFNANDSSVGYATLLGGPGNETPWGIGVDASGGAHVGGLTTALEFPVTGDAIQSARPGLEDGFLSKLNAAGSALAFSTYLGGAATDQVDAVAVDAGGAVYVAGTTMSSNFPTTVDAYQRSLRGATDVFVAKIDVNCQNTNSLSIVSGNNQTGTVGAALASPLVVELRNGCTGPVAGQTVTFASGGAALNPAAATTNASGRASTVATLGGTAGTVTITAAVEGVSPVTFTQTAQPAPSVVITSAAGYGQGAPAPGMIAVAWGTGFAAGRFDATSIPLPVILGDVTVEVVDSSGTPRNAGLFNVLSNQINFQFPEETQGGPATVRIHASDGSVQTANVTIESVSPGLFTQNSTVGGVAAGSAMRYGSDGTLKATTSLARWDDGQAKFVPEPIEMGEASDQVFLVLYGTGLKGRSSLANVNVEIGGEMAEALYVGEQPSFVGLDQVNVKLPRSAAGKGEIPLVLTIDGKTANTVTVQAAEIVP